MLRTGRPAVLLLAAATACSDANGSLRPPRALLQLAPERPAACREVAAGAPVQSLLDAATDGEALCLAPGVHHGPLKIRRGVTLWGTPAAVVRSDGRGTTISVEASGARLAGFTVDGSGARYDLLDAAVRVTGDDVVVEGLTVVHATYGILVERSRRALVRRNVVRGNPEQVLGLRGDGVRLWETSDSRIEDNLVEDSRDLVVWYSPRNRLSGNRVLRSRYAAHLMYSHDCVVERNQAIDSVVGVFIMYTRNVHLEGNLVSGSSGAAGMGIGLKDSGNVTVRNNRLVNNTIGLYIDNSPVQISEDNRIEGNLFRRCDRAVVFHGGAGRNHFSGNALADNRVQVEVEGGSGNSANWSGNYFDDYTGYDLDGDGRGDVAYELRSASAAILAQHPDLRFFSGAPALALADAASHLVPLFRPPLVARDALPLVRPPRFSEVPHHAH
jgi:nitrous oxidase accessory protein